MKACICYNITEENLRTALNNAAQPVCHDEIHEELGNGNNGQQSCCKQCKDPEGNRQFSKIVTEHNEKFPPIIAKKARVA